MLETEDTRMDAVTADMVATGVDMVAVITVEDMVAVTAVVMAVVMAVDIDSILRCSVGCAKRIVA